MVAGERRSARLVWDLPTRLVHWLIAALIPFSWWSATHDHLSWHILSGCTILGLLLFRMIWGFFGSSTARFSNFVAGPGRIRAYLGGRIGIIVGHNPLGGWSVVAMLGALAAQVALGLFSVTEDGLQGGPLSNFASFELGRSLAHLHHLVFWLVVALIAVVGLFCTGMIPVKPIGQPARFVPDVSAADGSPYDGRMDE